MSRYESGNAMQNWPQPDATPPVDSASLKIGQEHAASPALPPRLPANPMFGTFIGPEGLRVVWRLLLYLAMARATYLLFGAIIYYAQQAGMPDLWAQMSSEIALLFGAVIPAVILSRLERRAFYEYGLPMRAAFGKMFWIGAVWGIAALSVLMLTMHFLGLFTFGKLAIHGLRILKFAAFWGLFFLIVGLAEEFLLRGYLQFTLAQAAGFWPAALLLSAAFGAIHLFNPGEAWNGILAATIIGLFFCLTLRRTGTLWFAVGFHATWDWGESYLFSVPDSGGTVPGHLLKSSFHGSRWLTGGSVGPEGSILVFLLLGLLWSTFSWKFPLANDDAIQQAQGILEIPA